MLIYLSICQMYNFPELKIIITDGDIISKVTKTKSCYLHTYNLVSFSQEKYFFIFLHSSVFYGSMTNSIHQCR